MYCSISSTLTTTDQSPSRDVPAESGLCKMGWSHACLPLLGRVLREWSRVSASGCGTKDTSVRFEIHRSTSMSRFRPAFVCQMSEFVGRPSTASVPQRLPKHQFATQSQHRNTSSCVPRLCRAGITTSNVARRFLLTLSFSSIDPYSSNSSCLILTIVGCDSTRSQAALILPYEHSHISDRSSVPDPSRRRSSPKADFVSGPAST